MIWNDTDLHFSANYARCRVQKVHQVCQGKRTLPYIRNSGGNVCYVRDRPGGEREALAKLELGTQLSWRAMLVLRYSN